MKTSFPRALFASLALLCGASSCAAGGSHASAARNAPGAIDAALQQELAAMVKEDQAPRAAVVASHMQDAAAKRAVAEVDAKHLPRLKAIIDGIGWPGVSLVGSEGSHDAWLLVQHMDRDAAFQRRALERMAAAAAAGQASRSDVAYLTDRVLLREGKPQRYGTQFEMVDGTLVPKPMEDPAGVDGRRREMDMDTMAESAARMQVEYGMPALAVRPLREPQGDVPIGDAGAVARP